MRHFILLLVAAPFAMSCVLKEPADCCARNCECDVCLDPEGPDCNPGMSMDGAQGSDSGIDGSLAPDSGDADACTTDNRCENCSDDVQCTLPAAAVCAGPEGAKTCTSCTKDEDCTHIAGLPVCSDDGSCVRCTAENTGACPAGEKVCREDTHECVQCTATDDDACEGDTALCGANNQCVQCNSDVDCSASDSARCDAASHQCAPCDDSAQCAHMFGKQVCGAAGECVQCTGADHSACRTLDDMPASCDVQLQKCDVSRQLGHTGACEACISDHECVAGHVCVETSFGMQVQGLYCLPTTMAGCSALRPYAKYMMDVATIEAATLNACGLAYTTCAAMSGTQGYKANCGVNGAGQPVSSGAVRGENDLCGTDGLDDGFCVNAAPGEYRCTVPCFADEDCPDGNGITCQTKSHEVGSRKLCTL